MTVSQLQTKARPTNADLQAQVAEVHACIHQLAATVRQDRHDSRNRDQVIEGRLGGLDAQMARQEASIGLLVTFFGLRLPDAEGDARRRITLGSLEWWQAVLGMAAAVLGSLSAWKWLFPALVGLHHALLAAS